MYCPNGYYRTMPDLRARIVEELGLCLVYTPRRPNLYALNLEACLVLDLCRDGASYARLEKEYLEALGPEVAAAKVRQDLLAALDDLVAKNIIEASSQPADAQVETEGSS
jgi:hypothetical protein